MTATPGQTVKLVTCPACSRQVSPQAKSCPNCGHPFVVSVAEADAKIKQVGGVVNVTITVLLLGAQSAFLTFMGPGGDAGGGSMARVFLRTAPLTVAVMIIGLAIMRKWFEELTSFLFMSAGTLLASLLIGTIFGGLGELPTLGSNIITLPISVLRFYGRVYGAPLFLSSLILGVFLAWAITKRLPPKGLGK